MKTKLLILVIVIVSIILVISSIFASRNKSASQSLTEERPGFTQITSIDGASFYVNTRFVDSATAITQVSDNVSFSKDQYYSYKNGTDKYLLFNMSQLVVAAQKGTDFYICNSNDKEYSLQNANIMNIWFTKGSKKFETKTSDPYTVTTVCAGVTINSTVYGDFCGKLVNINYDNEEWSLFVGVPGERFDKLSKASQEGIEAIVESFVLSDNSQLLAQDVYAVSISGDNAIKTSVDTQEVVSGNEDTVSISETAVAEKDELMAYSSSPYNMLNLGDNGILSAFNDYTVIYEEPIVTPVKIYRGSAAKELIVKYCTLSGDHNYFDPPEGTSWEVVQYNLNYSHCSAQDYVDVKFNGLDGEQLRYRGIKYPQRTYDAFIDYIEEEDGIIVKNLYTYYAVPNGCMEYCLSFGDTNSVNGEVTSAAYYHILNLPEKKPEESNNHGEPTDTAEGNKPNEVAVGEAPLDNNADKE